MSLRIKTSICRYIILLLFASPFTLLAQTHESAVYNNNNYLSLNLGVGAGNMGIAGRGLAAGFGFSVYVGHLILTPRFAGVTEVMSTSYDRSVFDLGITIGLSTKTPGSLGYASIAAGISYVGGRKDAFTHISTVGFPLDAQLFFTPFSSMGIGFQGIANVNSERSFYGVLLCLQFGKLR